MHRAVWLGALLLASNALAAAPSLDERVIAWRRDFHKHPELGHAETRTSGIVAEHLRALGMAVRTGIAGTGVRGVLKGARPGRRIALRADMDALPVTEQTEVPFASTVTSTYRGEAVGVMHACGHDAHVAILMGVAEELARTKSEWDGEVVFVFQPAEEGPPVAGEIFGAAKMLQDGVFDGHEPDAVLALHVWSSLPVGTLATRPGPMLASADEWTVEVKGRQTHGSRPWAGVDPITVAAQILLASQAIVARQVDITASPVVLTAGMIKGGVRFNIIPESVQLVGTLRTFDPAVRDDVIARLERTARSMAEASGASATLHVANNAPVTRNDPDLYRRLLPALQSVAPVEEFPLSTVAEDYSHFANRVPGLIFMVGATPAGQDPKTAPANHSPLFFLDEGALGVGRRALLAATRRALKPD